MLAKFTKIKSVVINLNCEPCVSIFKQNARPIIFNCVFLMDACFGYFIILTSHILQQHIIKCVKYADVTFSFEFNPKSSCDPRGK